jgi:uncharacterized membrane protein
MWVILALGAALLTSFNPILYKRLLKDANPLVVVWFVNLLGLPLLGIFTWTLTPRLPQLDWVFVFAVLASSGLNVIAHLANTKALQKEDVSLVAPLLIFTPVFTLLVAAFTLGELPSWRGLIGVGLVLIGAYWLNRSSGAGWLAPFKKLSLKPGVLLVLLAGLLWAVTPVFEKLAIQHTSPQNPRLAAFAVEIIMVLLMTLPVMARGRRFFGKLTVHRRELLLAGLISGIAPVLGYSAFGLGLVGYVTTLFKLSTVLTVFWAACLLKEGGLAQRLPASLIMVVGAILIAL